MAEKEKEKESKHEEMSLMQLQCPACEKGVPAAPVSAFFAHVSACAGSPASSASPLAPLFTPRLHAFENVASVGPTAPTAADWPRPDPSMASSTPSTNRSTEVHRILQARTRPTR